jgi:hypothetical protein
MYVKDMAGLEDFNIFGEEMQPLVIDDEQQPPPTAR